MHLPVMFGSTVICRTQWVLPC